MRQPHLLRTAAVIVTGRLSVAEWRIKLAGRPLTLKSGGKEEKHLAEDSEG